MYKVGRSRTPQGVRGLKLVSVSIVSGVAPSHSARSAWIETLSFNSILLFMICRTPQGVRGLKLLVSVSGGCPRWSHSARSAWIETFL